MSKYLSYGDGKRPIGGFIFRSHTCDAIKNNRVLKITYEDRNGEITHGRFVRPLKLYYEAGGQWLLSAYCYLRKEERTFRAAGVLKLQQADEVEQIDEEYPAGTRINITGTFNSLCDGEYIVAQVGSNEVALISLKDGNRFVDPVQSDKLKKYGSGLFASTLANLLHDYTFTRIPRA